MTDITTQKDIYNIITHFYKKASNDDLLGEIFMSKIPAESWNNHMETITQFWCGVVFQTGNYSGRPFPKHIGLGLQVQHFDRWLSLFHETVETFHRGEKADLMKAMASNMAQMFMMKLGHIENNSNMISII